MMKSHTSRKSSLRKVEKASFLSVFLVLSLALFAFTLPIVVHAQGATAASADQGTPASQPTASTVGLNDPGSAGNSIPPATGSSASPAASASATQSNAAASASASASGAASGSASGGAAAPSQSAAAGDGSTNGSGGDNGSGGTSASGGSTSAGSGSATNSTIPSNSTTSSNSSSIPNPASPVSTQIPTINFSPEQVPFLLQRPLTGANNTVSPIRHYRQTADAYFQGCGVANNQFVNTDQRINISAVYTHFDVMGNGNTDPFVGNLKIVAIGAVDSAVSAVANGSSLVSEYATVLRIHSRPPPLTDLPCLSLGSIETQTRFLTFKLSRHVANICDRMYPTGPDYLHNLTGQYQSCTYGSGQVAFGVSVPLNGSYGFGSINTQIRIIDSSTPARTISCIQVEVSPYYPNSWYWHFLLYLPIALAIAYFVLSTLARTITAITLRRQAFKNKARPGGEPTFINDQLSPTVLAVLSAEPVVRSPALLRFVTPGFWDVIAYLQFVAVVGMIAVQWPEYVYPAFKQAAWSFLMGNVTLTQPGGAQDLWDPTASNAFLPESSVNLGDQIINNVTSPIFIDRSTPNTFLNLNGSRNGLNAYSAMVGLDQDDVFGMVTAIWLLIVAALVGISVIVWAVDVIQSAIVNARVRREARRSSGLEMEEEDEKAEGSEHRTLFARATACFGHHGSALHGNLVRLLALFHLPLVVVSVYQFSNGSHRSASSTVLAALSFAAFGVLAPAYVLWRISRHTTQDLYQRTSLLLSLGPVYAYYHPGSQLFPAVTFGHSLALGIVVGAGQASGSAQAIIFLVLEVLQAIAYILWLPWGDGSMMSPISFTWSMLRVITAVLVLLLSPVVNLSSQARGWITYVILFVLGVALLGLLLLLIAKLIESAIRILYKVTFDERLSHRNGGIGGALRRVRRRKYKSLQLRRGRPRHHQRSSSTSINKLMLAANSAGSTPLGGSTLRTTGSDRKASGYQDFGVYAAYLRADANDEGTIMSAMPSANNGSANQYGSSGSSPSTGFVRLGGARATDDQPYQLPSGHSRGSPAPNGAFGRESPHNSLSFAATTVGPRSRTKKRRRGFFRRAAMSSEDDTSDDELAGWTAEGQPNSRRWAGMAQISSAFKGLRSKLKREESGEEKEEMLGEPSGGTSFAVIRPPRNDAVPLARGQSSSQLLTASSAAQASFSPASRSNALPTARQQDTGLREQRYAPSNSSHGTAEEDPATREETFWMSPEAAAAKRTSQPHMQGRKQSASDDVIEDKNNTQTTPGARSAADMYASSSAGRSPAQASQTSLFTKHAQAQSAEILTLDE